MAEVQRLDNLVWEFLRYARPHEPDRRATSLHDVVERVIALLRVEAERASAMLDVDRSPAMPDVSIDAQQIEQVLLNVILNAIQASPPGARVRVCVGRDRQDAVIDVIDEGPGIPAEDVAHVFNPFFTTRDEGTGLGLAIAHRIVISHDGHIDVHQTSPRGACMRIRLPIGPSGDSIETKPRAQVQVHV
jgi:signal transduction histidine kinase